MEERLDAARQQLLLETVVSLAGELDRARLLERIVRAAAGLVGARTASLDVLGRDGRVQQRITHGVADGERAGHGDSTTGSHDQPVSRAFLEVPVRLRDEVFGNLSLTGKAGGVDFTERDEAIVEALAAAAGVVIENARVHADAICRHRWMEATAEITGMLADPMARDNALQTVVERACELAGADVGGVLLWHPPDHLEITCVVGIPADLVPDDPVPVDRSLSGLAARSGEMLVFEDVRTDPRTMQALLDLEGLPELGPALMVPLRTGAQVEGVLALGWAVASAAAFADLDLELPLRFAEQAALALQVARGREDHERLLLLEDRERIGRDLHDVVIQRLFAIGLTLENTGGDVGNPEAARRIAEAVDDIDTTIKDIRRSIFALSAPAAGDLRVVLDELVERAAGTLGFRPGLHTQGPMNAGLVDTVRDDLVAVLGEALTNVARHGAATRVDVHLDAGSDVEVVVVDNGRGLPGSVSPGGGLANMRARAERLGGSFDLESTPGGGTTLRWKVPGRPPGTTVVT